MSRLDIVSTCRRWLWDSIEPTSETNERSSKLSGTSLQITITTRMTKSDKWLQKEILSTKHVVKIGQSDYFIVSALNITPSASGTFFASKLTKWAKNFDWLVWTVLYNNHRHKLHHRQLLSRNVTTHHGGNRSPTHTHIEFCNKHLVEVKYVGRN